MDISTDNTQITPIKYECNVCFIICHKLSDWTRHVLTKKHKINMFGEKSQITFTCECGNIYKERTGLWRHKKKCNNSNSNSNNDLIKTNETSEIIQMMKIQMIENQEIRSLIIELLKKDAIKEIINK